MKLGLEFLDIFFALNIDYAVEGLSETSGEDFLEIDREDGGEKLEFILFL